MQHSEADHVIIFLDRMFFFSLAENETVFISRVIECIFDQRMTTPSNSANLI